MYIWLKPKMLRSYRKHTKNTVFGFALTHLSTYNYTALLDIYTGQVLTIMQRNYKKVRKETSQPLSSQNQKGLL